MLAKRKKFKTVKFNGNSLPLPSSSITNGNNHHASAEDFGKELPIYEAKARLIQRIRHSSVLVVLGETGSGKTTQIPKYIYEAGISDVGKPLVCKKKDGTVKKMRKKLIAITQPRRVAAISIAKRVATELGEEIGNRVGYSVRFENMTSEKTVIKYMTDGMLLRESIQDPNFNRYSFIIVDEAHERTVNTDLLLGLVKQAQEKRNKLKNKKKHLKLIIMSATIDTEKLQAYFPSANVVYIQGRQHSVKICQPIEHQEDYCFSTINLVLNLHKTLPIDHHILAFLTGQDEIDGVVQSLKEVAASDDRLMKVLPLSASISYDAQLKAVGPNEDGVRKVVISTNIAETSLTIPGIRVVIDCGFVKAKYHINGVGLDIMKIIPISQSQVWQRSGRAGRESDGICYRLYTAKQFSDMPKFLEPEIKRVNIAGVLLYLYKLGFNKPEDFDWMDHPEQESVIAAKEELVALGAIDTTVEPTELTPLGSRMAETPLNPAFSKILILSGDKYYVQEPITTILAMLASDSIFLSCDAHTQEKRKAFSSPHGDLITYLEIFRRFSKSNKKKEWCQIYKLNFRALKFVKSARKQLMDFCEMFNLPSLTCPAEDIKENIIKCFLNCLPKNLAYHMNGNKYRVHKSNYETITVSIHPSSSLHNRNHKVVSFTELIQIPSRNNYIKHCSFIDRAWI